MKCSLLCICLALEGVSSTGVRSVIVKVWCESTGDSSCIVGVMARIIKALKDSGYSLSEKYRDNIDPHYISKKFRCSERPINKEK